MLHLWLYPAVLLLGLYNNVYGYMIDADCGADTQFVQDRIDTAFRLIANTVTELNRNPINPDIQTLHTTLFGEPFDSTKVINIRNRFDELSRISPLNNADQTGNTVNGHAIAADVRFYCTTARIKKVLNTEKNTIEYHNKDRNVVYQDGALSSPGGRFANCFDILEPTLMITMTVEGQFSEIQICPWYLRKARGFAFRDLKDVSPSILKYISHIAMPLVARLVYRPIDLFVLTDKVIVHELTHTGQTVFPTIDMNPAAYGWTNAKQLVSIWAQSGHEARSDPIRNADSNALFAVGAWLMVQPGAAPIGVDGSFTKPQATPKAKM